MNPFIRDDDHVADPAMHPSPSRPLRATCRGLIAAVLVAMPASACSLFRPNDPFVPAADLVEFEARLDRLRGAGSTPAISAAIASRGQVVWARGFGFADQENQVAATETTSYHIASLTKTFASIIVMQLVESGDVRLDDPVSNYGITLQNPKIVRVVHLLTHTSDGVPGAQFRYDGDRYALLDQVIAQASGQTFAQRLEARILQPLGFTHTAPNVRDQLSFVLSGLDRATFERNLAQGYVVGPSGAVRTPYPRSFSTAAGLISTAVDLARYSIAIDSGRFLQPATWAQVLTPALSPSGDTLPHALGWFVSSYRGVRLVWHYGWWVGNSALLIRVPDRQLTFVVLANTDRLSNGYRLGYGDLLSSPYAREFLEAFVSGSAALPGQPVP